MATKKPIKSRDIISVMEDPAMFQPWFEGSSWGNWKTVLKAATAMPMTEAEVSFFKSIAGDRNPPKKRVKEIYIIVGRGGGKDSITSGIAAHTAAFFQGRPKKKIAGIPLPQLRRGEKAMVLALACDRDQARIVLDYTRSFFTDIEPLRAMVTRETKTGLELSNNVEITIATNDFRSIRGRSILCCIMDELAFYQSDNTARPDQETYRAVMPGLARIPGGMLIAISSPYRRAGLLWKKYKEHFGRDDDDVLVVMAPSVVMNPTLDQALVAKSIEEDPAANKAEWGYEFRSDLESFVNIDVIAEAVVNGRHELEPVLVLGQTYVCAIDAAGGSGGDSFAATIAHRVGDKIVVDAIREFRPPFSPDAVIEELCRTFLPKYGIKKVWSDKWATGFPTASFRRFNVDLAFLPKDKSTRYLECLQLLNSRSVELLDHKKLVSQFCSLERRPRAGGADRVDHPSGPNFHDDISDSCAGAIVMASGLHQVKVTWSAVSVDFSGTGTGVRSLDGSDGPPDIFAGATEVNLNDLL